MALAGDAAPEGFVPSMRCPAPGDKTVLIAEGDSKFEVLQKCGEPDYSEIVGFEAARRGNVKLYERYLRGLVVEKVEVWIYDCGDGIFTKKLSFAGDELVSIENLGYGSGEPKCW